MPYIPTQQEALSQSLSDLKVALANGFDLFSADDRLGTVWHHAVFSPARTANKETQARCAEVVDYLLSRAELPVPGPDEEGITPLALAIAAGELTVVERLVARGAKLGRTERPLIDVIQNGYAQGPTQRIALIKFLLDKKLVRAGDGDDAGWTAYRWAQRQKDSALVELLQRYEKPTPKMAKPSKGAKASLTHRPLAEAKALAKRVKGSFGKKCAALLDLAADQEGSDTVKLIEGDWRVKGDLQLAEPLVVTGDLVVSGVLNDCFHAEFNVLVVFGSVRCRAYLGEGETLIGGDLKAEVAYLDSSFDNTLRVGGSVQVPCILAKGHTIQAGKIDPRSRLVRGDLHSNRKFRDVPKHIALDPALLKPRMTSATIVKLVAKVGPDEVEDRLELDPRAILARIRAGKRLAPPQR